MISERTLARAVENGILSGEQAGRLRALEAGTDPLAPSPDDEQLRLLTGFADIFVTLGIALFLGGIVFLMAELPPWQIAVAVALAAWLLAEMFTRRRRMALPSIVLMLVFTAATSLVALTTMAGNIDAIGDIGRSFLVGSSAAVPPLLVSSLVVVGAAALHYWRFRVPITVAAACAGLTATLVYSLALVAPDFVRSLQRPIIFACGLLFFAIAMWFDRQDLKRQTRLSDIAFWLHMLAAPLLVHSLIGYFVSSLMLTLNAALLILAIFAALGLVAVLIDRRAMLVSGLIYLAIAFSSVLREATSSTSVAALTVLALGAFILLISAAWQSLRGAVLAPMPAGIRAWVPPARQMSTG